MSNLIKNLRIQNFKSIKDLSTRADTVQQQIDRKRTALLKQFTEMERAISNPRPFVSE